MREAAHTFVERIASQVSFPPFKAYLTIKQQTGLQRNEFRQFVDRKAFQCVMLESPAELVLDICPK